MAWKEKWRNTWVWGWGLKGLKECPGKKNEEIKGGKG
jgi:hypothetical protein